METDDNKRRDASDSSSLSVPDVIGRYMLHVARPHPALKRVDAVEDRGSSSAFLHLTHKQVRSLPLSPTPSLTAL